MISQRHSISPFLAKLLLNRNIFDEDIENFLNPDLFKNLPDPFILKDMKKSVKRTYTALIKNEKIGIIADYDVDGSTSAAILTKFFELLNKQVLLKIPNRLADGYGPNHKIMNELIEKKIDLLFTLDCGTTSFNIFDQKKFSKLDTIIIDHHISEKILPNVFSIINPNRFDEKRIFQDLAAVGVTFIFLLALRKYLREKNFFNLKNMKEPNLLSFLDLVALGTVCDVVNLRNYNRVFVKKGLEIIKKRNNKGIAAIIDNSKIMHVPSTSDLGYIIGPQLNSASRIDESSLSSQLLISNNIIEIENISKKIFLLNEKRKLIEQKILEQAFEQCIDQKNRKILIVKGNFWHKGVLGIIASRVTEKYNKPSIVISLSDKICVGSARSIKDIDIGNIILIAKEKGFLLNGGGHQMAAGITLGAFAGFNIDKWLDSSPIMFIVFFLLGAGSGMFTSYRTIKKMGLSPMSAMT